MDHRDEAIANIYAHVTFLEDTVRWLVEAEARLTVDAVNCLRDLSTKLTADLAQIMRADPKSKMMVQKTMGSFWRRRSALSCLSAKHRPASISSWWRVLRIPRFSGSTWGLSALAFQFRNGFRFALPILQRSFQPHRRAFAIDRIVSTAAAHRPTVVEGRGVGRQVGHQARIERHRAARDPPFAAAPLEAVDIARP